MGYQEKFQTQINKGNIHHAYLFLGKYADKLTPVHWLCKALHCNLADQLMLVKKGTITIGEVRQLRKGLALAPHSSPWKVAVISPAEKMTIEAQNALLKILEEPPSRSVIILVAEDEDRLLPTIISRCQRVQFKAQIEDIGRQQDKLPEDLLGGQWSIEKRFKWANELAKGEDLPILLDGWLMQVREKSVLEPEEHKWIALSQAIMQAKRKLESNVNTRLILENLLLNFES